MSLKIVACPHPFTSERNEHTLDAGLTYAEIVEHCIPHAAHHTIGVMRNDEPIEHSRWHEKPTDDSTIYLRAIPAGSAQEVGQDVGKVGAFAILLGAFLFIAGLATFNPALMAAGFYTFGAGVAVGVVGGIITWAGNLYDELSGLSTEEAKTNPGIRGGRNSLTPWGAVPIIVGKTLVTPPYGARPYTEIGGTDGVEQYLRMLFVVGHGPLKITQLKIGENLLATNVADIRNGTITVDGLFTGVDLEIKQGAGSMTLYPKVVVEEQPNIGLLCPGGTPTEVIRTTPPKTTEISVDITFPYGLVKYDSDGTPTNSSVNVVPEYRRKGDSTWLALGTWSGVGSTTITRDEAETKRFTCVKASLTAETYEVRMRRTTADSTDSKERNSVSWTALRSKRDEDPLSSTAQAGVVRVAVKIKATDQLNGIIDQLNMIAESVFPIYSGTGSGAAQWASSDVTRNPAAIFLALLRGSMNPRPVPDAKIDFAAIEAWYAYCITKSFTCDGLISSADTLKSIMAKVTGTGRASLTMRDGLYSVIVDNARSAPVQYLTPRNSHSFKGAKAFPEKLHALKISFINADQGYAIDQCIVYDDGYNSGNATNYESIDLWGVTSYDQAWKQGRYLIACRRLRPEVFTLSVDVEHLVCTRGDMVAVSHDLPLWGLCAGRIKNVTLDGSNNIIAIDVDEACTMEAGKTYGVKIRTNAATGVSAAVNLVVGEQYTLVPTTPIAPAAGVEVGNLFMFGESSSETVDCIVAGIQVNEDLSAELTLVEYAPDIQNADTGTIPAFDSKITLPANFAVESVARDIVIAPEGPPGPQGPSGGSANPPTNNVTNVSLAYSQNADGSVRVVAQADIVQGANPADGIYLYYKSALSAPGVFDFAADWAKWKPVTGDDTYTIDLDLPSRTGGSGGAALHYRFGLIAGAGVLLHASGVVTPTGWDDKVFDASLQFDQYNYWNLVTGELRAGTVDSFLKVTPSTGEIEIDNADMRLREAELYTFKGTGASRKSLAHEELALVWYDDPVGGTKKEIGRMELDVDWNRVVFRGNIQNAKDRIKSALFSLLLMQPSPFSMSAGNGIVQILYTFNMYDYLAVTYNGTVYRRKGNLWESLYSADYVSRVNGMCYSSVYGVFIFLTNSLLLRMDHGGRGNFWIEDNTPFGNSDVAKNAINQVDTLNTLSIAKVANSYTRNYGAGWTTAATIGTTAIAYSAGGNASSQYVYVVAGASGYCATKISTGAWTARTSQFGTTQINVAKGVGGGSGYILLLGNDGKISKSTDGSTFVLQTSGLTTGDHIIDALYDANNGIWWACTSNNKIIKGNNLGTIWTLQTGVPTLPAGVSMRSIAIDYSNEVLIGCDGGIVVKTNNSGTTWSVEYLSPFNFGAIIGPTYHAPNQSFYFCGNGSTVVVKSDNPETSFTQVTAPPNNIRKLLSGNGVLVAVTSFTSTVYYSNNNGSTWQTAASPPSIAVISNWSASTFDGAYFFLTSKYEVWRSADGNTWTRVRTDTGDHTASECGILAAGSRILLYGPTHVFKSTDHGSSWQELAVPATRLTNHYGYVGWHSDVRKESVFVIYEKAYIIADDSDTYTLFYERFNTPLGPVFELFGFWFIRGVLVNGYNDYEIVQRGNSVISPAASTFTPFEHNGKTYVACVGHIGLLDY